MDEHGIVSRDDWGPTCARCGDPEFRIDGFCSIYCRDMAELEAEIKRLEIIESQAIEQSEYIQVHGLTEYEKAGQAARIADLEAQLADVNYHLNLNLDVVAEQAWELATLRAQLAEWSEK